MSRSLTVELNQTAASTATGEVRGHTVAVDRPESKGGADAGPMGGELLLLGLGGCFLSNLFAAIRAREADVTNVRVRVEAEIGEGPERFTAFVLHVTADHKDRSLLEKLCTIAERGCLVANTLASCSPVEVVVED